MSRSSSYCNIILYITSVIICLIYVSVYAHMLYEYTLTEYLLVLVSILLLILLLYTYNLYILALSEALKEACMATYDKPIHA